MDRLRSGFHRKSRKASPSRPTIVTDGTHSSGKTTPEPVSAHSPLQVPHLPNKEKKTSPFRSLRDFSRSHKRARSPAAGSLPRSPIGATYTFDVFDDRPATSPTVRGGSGDLQTLEMNGDAVGGQPPRMPSFLSLSPQEIVAKFQEIVWMERNRIMQSLTNPSPDFKWARVTGDHLKRLDRYMNIQPWENNRVRLRVPPGKVDYVNASPIILSSTTPHQANRPQAQDRNSKEDTIVGLSDLAGSGPERYIAMQGPKRMTTDHVWRMVVEQLASPAVIVMLTETHEAHMEKCYPYFPRSPDDAPLEINERDEFGDAFRASVHCEAIEETEAGDAIELRKLIIRSYKSPAKIAKTRGDGDRDQLTTPVNAVDGSGDVKMLSPLKAAHEDDLSADDSNDDKSANVDLGESTKTQQKDLPLKYEERIVWHFLYKKWPDFGVPALEDLDSFFTLMRLSREKNASPENPRIVHCSAGVGRSGTFIALEHLMRELDAGALEHWDSPSHFRHKRTDEGGSASTEGTNNGQHQRSDDDSEGKMEVEEQVVPTEVEGDDLIFHTVNQLREQRRSMVQAEPQFLFIYQVMRKLWEDRYGPGGSSPTGAHQTPPKINGPSDAGGEESDTGQPARKRQEFDPFVEQQDHQA
ncbi:tyrosine phosphatase 2 [Diaporthe amygdali]|uniref:tyrosine phosphatase 2 n=1 Tax=Phomopsis amygdali TaxID=1214568 RepID=UPI0022FE7163|nr:tyrosine phosphatase 2 [Diaporthe amygdali]KAJ0117259.1 tyrosine phosphatase 2 [Diaporthe amygdali]